MRLAVLLLLLLVGACGSGAPGERDGGSASADGGAASADGGAASADGGGMAPSPTSDLGATLTPDGAWFSVWAPNADAVAVAGEFNSWSATASPLTRGDGGIWSTFAGGASAGQQYHFLVTRDGGTANRNDPRARALTDSRGLSILVSRDYAWKSDFTPSSFDEMVIYEMHVGAFNPPGGATPGHFSTVTEKLDYLAALGVNMLELLPVSEFSGSQSWGYNPGAPFAVESSYGGPDELKALIDAAHAHGIGVMLDVVHNHYVSGRDDILRCWDGDCLGKDGVYFYTDARESTPWGPRPDFSRPEVRAFIVDNTIAWLDEFRVDGFRWDSVSNIRTANGADNPDGWRLLTEVSAAVHARPGKLHVAEDLAGLDSITQPAPGGGGFDAQWDAAFFRPVDDNLVQASDANRSMAQIRDAIQHSYNGVSTERVVYTESHDVVANGAARIPQQISPSDPGSVTARKLSTLGAIVAFTSPGIPMLFMGQEFLEDGSFSDSNPLDWTKTSTFSGILRLYTDLIHLRRNLDGHTAGLRGENVSVYHVNESAKVLAWRRWSASGPGDDVLIIANFSGRAFPVYQIGLPQGGTWRVRLNSDSIAYSADYGGTSSPDVTAAQRSRDGFPWEGTLAIGAYSALVLSQ
jgi:1,4-alpha-glucan branching enzyme